MCGMSYVECVMNLCGLLHCLLWVNGSLSREIHSLVSNETML